MIFREANGAVIFPVRVVPRSSRNQIVRVEGDALKIRLTAPPVEGKANEALVKFLAEFLNVSRSQIQIMSGDKSKSKMVRVRGVTKAQIKDKIGPRP